MGNVKKLSYRVHPLQKQPNLSTSSDILEWIPLVTSSAPFPRLKDLCSDPNTPNNGSEKPNGSNNGTVSPKTLTKSGSDAKSMSKRAGENSDAPPSSVIPMIQINTDGESSVRVRRRSSISTPASQMLRANQIQELIQQAITFHESDNLKEAFKLYCTTAAEGAPIGLILTGLSLRHGWGCTIDVNLAFSCLEHATENSLQALLRLRKLLSGENEDVVSSAELMLRRQRMKAQEILERKSSFSKFLRIFKSNKKSETIASEPAKNHNLAAVSPSAAATVSGKRQPSVAQPVSLRLEPLDKITEKDRIQSQISKFELAMSIYELGQCYRYGWGAHKSKSAAAIHYRIAADLGDIDAQTDVAQCFELGEGLPTNRYLAASYYRLAALQGRVEFGMAWIYKEKYSKFFQKNFPKQFAQENAKTAKKKNASLGRKKTESTMNSLGIDGKRDLHSSMGVLMHVQSVVQTVVEESNMSEQNDAEKPN